MSIVSAAFEPMLGTPSWSVRQGYGSFLTLEFGEPVMTVGAPRDAPVFLGDAVPLRLPHRMVVVRGTWHLWIYLCDWSLSVDGVEIAHAESDATTIARALFVLDGQALTAVDVRPTDGATTFTFDLGGTLSTRPAPVGTYDEPVEQWLFFQPSGQVLSVRSDGTWKEGPGSSAPDDIRWIPIRT